MASTARAIYGSYAAPVREPRRNPNPGIKVLPGKGRGEAATRALAPATITAFKAAVVVIAFLLIVCGVRIWLSASTLENLETVKTLETGIDTAQAQGNDLEVQRSILASPTRIEKKAKALGMVPSTKTVYITVKVPNTVATLPDGSISIADTLANIADSGITSAK